MPFISASYPHWSGLQCSLCVCLALLLSYTLVVASDQMQRCAELQSDSQSASSWDYCVDERPTSRNWYRSMAACRSFGGELVSLEWPEKIEDIQKLLSGRGVKLSNGVFVNAHRPFYSANGFAWRSGMKLQLQEDVSSSEECVKYSSTEFWPIQCVSEFQEFPLVCQRFSPRTPEMESLLMGARDLKASINWLNHTNYSAESCVYSSIVRFDYTWYQAKQLCENINGELLGMPTKEECRLIDDILNKRVKSKHPELFLNVHAKMYARNDSYETFHDFSGKTFNDSECVWRYEENKEEYCVLVKQNKILSPHKCQRKDSPGLKGFICKQCRPNTHSYEKTTSYNYSTSYIYLYPPQSSASHPVSLSPLYCFSGFIFGLIMGIIFLVGLIFGLSVVFVWYCFRRKHGKDEVPQASSIAYRIAPSEAQDSFISPGVPPFEISKLDPTAVEQADPLLRFYPHDSSGIEFYTQQSNLCSN